MRVLLSVKPEYANLILAGAKRFEFRRKVFQDQKVEVVVVYASSPVKKVVGEFEVQSIISGSPVYLWRKTKNFAGIKRKKLLSYFAGLETGYAIKIGRVIRYAEPKDLHDEYGIKPPQSFVYLKASL